MTLSHFISKLNKYIYLGKFKQFKNYFNNQKHKYQIFLFKNKY